jgi:hypothetical protein
VSLINRPIRFDPWEESILSPDFLQAIGRLAVASAEFEDTLHYIYWRYARLNAATGPVITEHISPWRLSDDIIRLAVHAERNKRRVEDLRDILSSYKRVALERNSCIHWLWALMGSETAWAVRPAYKGPGEGKIVSVAQLNDLAADMAWLQVRLRTHLYTDKWIKQKKASLWPGQAEIAAPAPWLNRPQTQDPKSSQSRATRRLRSRQRRSSPE